MPVNLDKRALWMKAISSGSSTTFECNSEEVGSMHVCAKHFESKYVTEKFRLLNTACPTLFTDEEISSGIPSISYPEIDILGINCDHTYFARLHCDHNYAKPHHKSRATEPPAIDLQNSTATNLQGATEHIVFTTPDKLTCAECTCFPIEDPYEKPKKLKPCQKSPLTLYELAAGVVDRLVFPPAFTWGEAEVARWMVEEVGLPEYKECISSNKINGRRLLMLEDPSQLPAIGIRCFKHVQMITSKVHALFGTEYVKYNRSIGLPPRKPLTHCTGFKSRTGPSWGVRVNWSRTDVLRWMKILMPEPLHLDHWDLVWYHEPEFPKLKFARIGRPEPADPLPHYTPVIEECREIMVPRKFRIIDLPREQQMIWTEKPPSIEEAEVHRKKMPKPTTKPKETSLFPKPVSCKGLAGSELLLARRKMNRPKFLPQRKQISV